MNSILAALSRRGAKNDGMGNIRELLINVVILNKPKVLLGLNQKVRGMVRGLLKCLSRVLGNSQARF